MRFQDGTLLLDGKTPEELGVPQWRTQVTYVPQSRTQQKGTPSELYYQAQVVGFFWMSSFMNVNFTLLPVISRSGNSLPTPCSTESILMSACACAAIQGTEGQAAR